MVKNQNADAQALRAIIRNLQSATARNTKLHNKTNDVGLIRLLNEVNPDIIALTMKLQDRLRNLQQSA